jgi:hypothetical protein
MTKISELGRIVGSNTKSRDLFVTVSLDQGEDGTKNITRRELVQAIQQEIFDNIQIEGGTIDNTVMTDNNMNISVPYTPDLADENYFYVKDVSNNQTVAISFAELTDEIAKKFKKIKKIYVSEDAVEEVANGSYLRPYGDLQTAFNEAIISQNDEGIPVSITVMPGNYFTDGNLALPDECSMVSTNGQYATKIIMNNGFESVNCILVGSGCYVQGFSFDNLKVDNFDEPTSGFAIAFRPGATILRSPYVRDCSQISNYRKLQIDAPVNPRNSLGGQEDLGFKLTLSDVLGSFLLDEPVTIGSVTGFLSRVSDIGSNEIHVRNNSGAILAGETITTASGGAATIVSVSETEDFPNFLAGRGGGMLLADRAVLDPDSIFPYMLAFGATPRSQNGIGYVAKNGAGINGISSISIFQRCSFYAIRGAQITLNNSGTQFGDISMRANGVTPVVNPYEASAGLDVYVNLADTLNNPETVEAILDDMYSKLVLNGYNVNEDLTRRDGANLIKSLAFDFRLGSDKMTRVFSAGFFDYKADLVFNPTASAGSDTLLQAFVDSFEYMRSFIATNYAVGGEITMLNELINNVLVQTLTDPEILTFGSLIESIAHQFNLAGAGINQNALPLNFRRVGRAVSALGSVVGQNGGRVRFSGADEVNNQYFAKGLRINGRNGKIEGRPFTSSVRRLARRAANSRI